MTVPIIEITASVMRVNMVSLREQKKSQINWDVDFLLDVTRLLLGYKVAADVLYA